MRSLNSRATLAIGIAAIAASAAASGSGCSATKPTEIVPGALTQVQVPRDLAAMKLIVNANGKQVFCQGYTVSNGAVALPSTLGVIGGSTSTTLRVSLYGYDSTTAASPDVQECNALLAVDAPASNGGPGARVLRQAVLTYVDQQTLFLPMPLSFSCYDLDCSSQGADSTCVAGQCASGDITASSLATFNPALVDGTQECFNPTQCFSASGTGAATVVDEATCTFGMPGDLPAGAASAGFNVRLTYTDVGWVKDPISGLYGPNPGVPLEQEILNTDPNEGYSIPDSTNPTQFALAQGLCNLYHAATTPPSGYTPSGPASSGRAYHTISNVDVAVGCPSKLPLLPFCQGQQQSNVSTAAVPPTIACGVAIPVEQTPSAIYLVMDESDAMNYGATVGAFGPTGSATVMNLSFAFPVFKHTYVAFQYLSGATTDCTGPTTQYTSPLVPFGLAPDEQPTVAKILKTWMPPDPPPNPPAFLDLQAAMRLDTGAYKTVLNFAQQLGSGGSSAPLNVAGVMFFVNRTPTSGAAGGGGDAGAGDAGGSQFPETASDCNPTVNGKSTELAALIAEAQAAQSSTPPLNTYFVVLDDAQGNGGQDQVPFYNQIASAPGTGTTVIDATSTKAQIVFGNFQKQVSGVATCLYDEPAGTDNTAIVNFITPPGIGLNVNTFPVPSPDILHDSSCNVSNQLTSSNSGWNLDNGRIRICGPACVALQGTIGAAAAQALEPGDAGADAGFATAPDGGVPVIQEVPVTVTMPCGGSAGSP
jgi:hypothetical protein